MMNLHKPIPSLIDLHSDRLTGLNRQETEQIVWKVMTIMRLYRMPESYIRLRRSFKTCLDFVVTDDKAFNQLNRDDLNLLIKIKNPFFQRIILSSDKFFSALSEKDIILYGTSGDMEVRTRCAESTVFAKKIPLEVLNSFVNDEPDVVSALANNETAIARLSKENVEKIASRTESFVRRALISNKKAPRKLSNNMIYGFLIDPEPSVRIAAIKNPEVLKLISRKRLKKLLDNEKDWRVIESLKMQLDRNTDLMRIQRNSLYTK